MLLKVFLDVIVKLYSDLDLVKCHRSLCFYIVSFQTMTEHKKLIQEEELLKMNFSLKMYQLTEKRVYGLGNILLN